MDPMEYEDEDDESTASPPQTLADGSLAAPLRARSRREMPASAVVTLRSWLAAHFAYPYPAPHEQAQLLQDTGIEKKQLKNWLTNARRRTWRPACRALSGDKATGRAGGMPTAQSADAAACPARAEKRGRDAGASGSNSGGGVTNMPPSTDGGSARKKGGSFSSYSSQHGKRRGGATAVTNSRDGSSNHGSSSDSMDDEPDDDTSADASAAAAPSRMASPETADRRASHGDFMNARDAAAAFSMLELRLPKAPARAAPPSAAAEESTRAAHQQADATQQQNRTSAAAATATTSSSNSDDDDDELSAMDGSTEEASTPSAPRSPAKRSPVKARSPAPKVSAKGDGQRGRSPRELPLAVVAVLRAWLEAHFDHPYPTSRDRGELMNSTNLDEKQLKNWFTNARRRVWKPAVLVANEGRLNAKPALAPRAPKTAAPQPSAAVHEAFHEGLL